MGKFISIHCKFYHQKLSPSQYLSESTLLFQNTKGAASNWRNTFILIWSSYQADQNWTLVWWANIFSDPTWKEQYTLIKENSWFEISICPLCLSSGLSLTRPVSFTVALRELFCSVTSCHVLLKCQLRFKMAAMWSTPQLTSMTSQGKSTWKSKSEFEVLRRCPKESPNKVNRALKTCPRAKRFSWIWFEFTYSWNNYSSV